MMSKDGELYKKNKMRGLKLYLLLLESPCGFCKVLLYIYIENLYLFSLLFLVPFQLLILLLYARFRKEGTCKTLIPKPNFTIL